MKERPMIFSDADMRAIREDRKTQVRQIIKPQPVDPADEPSLDPVALVWRWDHSNERRPPATRGDLILCRETCSIARNILYTHREGTATIESRSCVYRADEAEPIGGLKWTPSIHMPRWACRETLRVLSVRPERLQDITEEDAPAEGFENGSTPTFAWYWDDLHAKRGHPWESNPWVWRYEFERVK